MNGSPPWAATAASEGAWNIEAHIGHFIGCPAYLSSMDRGLRHFGQMQLIGMRDRSSSGVSIRPAPWRVVNEELPFRAAAASAGGKLWRRKGAGAPPFIYHQANVLARARSSR